MTSEELDLARRLAAVPGIWRAGMRWIDVGGQFAPVRVVQRGEGVRLTADEHQLYRPSRDAGDVPTWPDWAPDLDDAATRGALLDVAREKWGDPLLHVRWSWTWKKWYVYGADHRWPGLLGGLESEGAAIALAILEAPASA